VKRYKSYPDLGLRKNLDCWVFLDSSGITPPRRVKLRNTHLAGYLYVDHTAGFLLRVGAEVARQPNGGLCLVQDLARARWDLPYATIITLDLNSLTSVQAKSVGLPPRRIGLGHYNDSDQAACRCRTSIDPFCVPGHPDLLRGWAPVGDACTGGPVLVRVEREEFPSVYEGVVLQGPAKPDGLRRGDRVRIVELEIEGHLGLFRIQEKGRKT
jgi:hypothetical protein